MAFTVAIQPDGKIVAAGMQGRQLQETFAVARFNADGTLDDTFGRGGTVTTRFSKHSSEAHALAIQRDGRIVVVGTVVVGFHSSGPFPQPDLPLTDFAVARYRKNGLLDRTFGFRGKAITDFNGPTDETHAVIVRRAGHSSPASIVTRHSAASGSTGSPWRDIARSGQPTLAAVVLELLKRLAVLTPRPRVNLILVALIE